MLIYWFTTCREGAMHFSVSTWNWASLLKDGLSYRAMLEDIQASGFGIELWLATMSEADIGIYEQHFKGCFPTVSCHTSLANSYDDEILRKEIALCERIEASLMVVHPCSIGFDAHTWDTHYGKPYDSRRFDCLEHYISLAEKHDVLLALENGPVEVLEQVMDHVESKHLGAHLGICIDTGHASMHMHDEATYLYHLLRRFLPHVAQLHIHDNHGIADDHLLPGAGIIDWNQVMGIVSQRREDISFVFELKGQSDPLHSAIEARRFIEHQ